MGQRANSGRNATLDEQKRRAQGRQQESPQSQAIRDSRSELPAKGKTGGAFGKEGVANRRGAPTAKDAPINTPRSSRRARSR